MIPKVNRGTLVMVIEQLLMLLLIVGRWMLPKGELTRGARAQLLLCYIGIIEFFDSFKVSILHSLFSQISFFRIQE